MISWKEKGLKNLLGEEIQKDFFDENPANIELSEESREFLISVRTQLQEMSKELSDTLTKANV